jgi:hypothetical protein
MASSVANDWQSAFSRSMSGKVFTAFDFDSASSINSQVTPESGIFARLDQQESACPAGEDLPNGRIATIPTRPGLQKKM